MLESTYNEIFGIIVYVCVAWVFVMFIWCAIWKKKMDDRMRRMIVEMEERLM